MAPARYDELARSAFAYPAIDNHTHPLLTASHKDDFPFEGLLSEATGDALTEDAIHTLACYRATTQLSKVLQCNDDWEAVKKRRSEMDYEELCQRCMKTTGIQCVLLDDGLDGEKVTESVGWHDQYSSAPSKRIVRVEVLAQDILKNILLAPSAAYTPISLSTASSLLSNFSSLFDTALNEAASDPSVAGFKSVACYRTGLDVSPEQLPLENIELSLMGAMRKFEASERKKLRLEEKVFNDYLVRLTMEVAGKHGKPVQFHTGLGDNDIILTKSSPAHLQPLIAAYPNTPVVLLHASYPFTREAGYLASVYKNVWLDFGEVFPFVSKEGQKAVVRQVLELCPTSKILWSTDGHWWPETYYLGTIQAREVLYDVLAESVEKGSLSETQAVGVVQRALFHNANRLYKLGLEPDLELGRAALAMAQQSSNKDGSKFSKHVYVLAEDVMEYSHHRQFDKDVRAKLRDPSNARLKKPENDDDFFKLTVLILNNCILINTPGKCVDMVKEYYLGDNVSETIKDDFKNMLNICLEYGRFRSVRICAPFYVELYDSNYTHLTTPLEWEKVAEYHHPQNVDVDWE